MSFPLTVGDRVIADPPALAELVRADCGPGTGLVVPGRRPAGWVLDLVTAGALPRKLAVGLAAALIHEPRAPAICEGARLARGLGEGALGALILRALEAHDTALLLARDPASDGGSVEDALLEAAGEVCELSDPPTVCTLLERTRNAGLRELELRILLDHGSPDDLREWLPAVLSEALTPAERLRLTTRAARDDDGGRIVSALLTVPGARPTRSAGSTSPPGS